MSDNNNLDQKKRFLKIAIPLWLGSGLSIMGDSAIYAVLPLYVGVVGISLSNAGILMGINRIVRLFSNSVCGYLFDFGNQKKLFVASLFLGSSFSIIFGLFSGFPILFFARVLWGIAWSGILIGGTSILAEETTPANRGRWIGIHYFWISVGNVCGYVLGGFLSDIIGFQPTMIVNGLFSLGGAFFALFFLPDTKNPQKEKISFSSFRKNSILKIDLTLALYASLLGLSRLIFAGFIVTLLSVITREKISPFITVVGISTLTGLIAGIRTSAEMSLTPFAGFISDKFKNRLFVIIISLLFGIAGLILLSLGSPYMIILGLLICTIPSASIAVIIRTLVGDYAAEKNNQGRAMGFVMTVGDLASAVGPIFAFRILPYVTMDMIFRLMALILVFFIFVIIAYMKKENTKP